MCLRTLVRGTTGSIVCPSQFAIVPLRFPNHLNVLECQTRTMFILHHNGTYMVLSRAVHVTHWIALIHRSTPPLALLLLLLAYEQYVVLGCITLALSPS